MSDYGEPTSEQPFSPKVAESLNRLGEEADRAAALAEYLLHPADGDARSFGVQSLVDLWIKPIAGPMAIVAATSDKKLGELTMPEFCAWACVLGYAGMTGYVLGKLAANVIIGPARRMI